MVGIAKFQASKTSSEPRVKSKSSSPEESILGKIQIQTIQTLNKSMAETRQFQQTKRAFSIYI
jgi:hypothetical protein